MTDPCANSRVSQSSYYDIRNLRLQVRRWPGEGRLRVILHGWLDLSATWQRVVQHLPPQWDIAAPDQRGFGLSQAAGDTYWFYDYLGDLDGLLDQLSPQEPVDLIGHSMGAQVAALYAGIRPQRVRRLVALDGFYLPRQDAAKAPRQLRNWLEELNHPPAAKTYPSLDDLAARIRRRQTGLDAEGARFVARCWSRPLEGDRVELLGDGRHRQRGPLLYRDEEALAIFSEVQAPTLILDGAKSAFAGMGQSEDRRRRLNCFRKREEISIPQAGHMLHFDAPQATAEALTSFLEAP